MVRHKGIIEPSRLPAKWSGSKAVVLLHEDTRWYVERSTTSFRHWINELKDAGIYTIPLQYVSEYVGVSRESVLKRAKTGGLTVFSFIFPELVKNIFGKCKERDGKKRVDLVPLSECDQWRDILMDISEYGDFVQDTVS